MIYGASQTDQPCVLHRYHRPVTVVNELHHPFPQEWQKAIWGRVLDDRKVSICATAHNTVHAALRHYEEYGEWPDYCIGRTRDLAQLALDLQAEALGG